MVKNIFGILKVLFVIVGTIIGAGFVSGKEIYLFFNTYGKFGVLGFFFTSLMFSIVIYRVFLLAKKMNCSSYSKFSEEVNQKNIRFIKRIILYFLLISFYIMVAGMSAYFKQQYKIPEILTATIMSFTCYQILKRNIEGIITLNNLLIPFIIVFIMVLGVKNTDYILNCKFEINKTNSSCVKFLLSSVLYASYNSLILIPIIVELSKKIGSKKNIVIVTIMCFFIMFVLGVNIIYIIQSGGNYLRSTELPMVEIVKRFGIISQRLYGVVIIIAIITSAIASAHSFLEEIRDKKGKFKKELLLICVVAPVISQIGFSKLVKVLYPIFGILGLWQIYNIFSYKRDNKNY